MTDQQIKEYLKNRGCPDHVWQGGREGLIQQWKTFVAEVERGYCPACLVEEYWNDLGTQELIHDIGSDGDVLDEDKKFAAMLTATESKHSYVERNSDYGFWNFGYPKNATGYFLGEMKRAILKFGVPKK